MKIVYVDMEFPGSSFISVDINALRAKGHDVSSFCLRPKLKDYDQLVVDRGHNDMNIQSLTFKNFMRGVIFGIAHPFLLCDLLSWIFRTSGRQFHHLRKSLALVPSALYIYELIRREPPDIVHLFWGHYPSMVGYLVLKYMPEVVLSIFLGAYDLNLNYGGSVYVGNRADVLFTHAAINLKSIQKKGINNANAKVVYRGTILNQSTVSWKQKIKDHPSLIFLTVSRLIKDKGTDEVLSVFSGVLSIYSDAKLYVLGEGPDLPRLKKLCEQMNISRNVVFEGKTPHSEVLNHMNKAQFFLLLSRTLSERLPNCVKEAMFQKCVCITTSTTGIEELIDDGKNGYIVKALETESTIELIKTLISDPNTCISVTEQAAQTITDKFDVNKNMQQYVQAWQKAQQLKRRILKSKIE